jgi:plasmid stability protein
VAQVLIRQLDDDIVDALKRRAKASGRSLEAELREILREAASDPWEELLRIREALSGRSYSDSSELAREAPRK